MKNSSEILYEMKEVLDDASFAKSAVLLDDKSSHLLEEAPSREKVQAVIKLLKVRQEISDRTGKKVYGLRELIDTLLKLDEAQIIVGYGYISSNIAGNFYFSETENKALGAIIVDR